MATKALPSPIPGIEEKSELKLLGKTFNEDPCKMGHTSGLQIEEIGFKN